MRVWRFETFRFSTVLQIVLWQGSAVSGSSASTCSMTSLETALATRPLHSERSLSIRSRCGVGAYVRQLRDELGMTQAELAAAVGLSNDAISKIEGGTMNLPSVRAADFAQSLEVTPREFGLVIFGHHDPHLFALVFPCASLEPFAVPDDALRRCEAVLERSARRARLQGRP